MATYRGEFEGSSLEMSLVDAWRSHPDLYNLSLRGLQLKAVKDAAIIEIGHDLSMPVDVVNMKMQSLRSAYGKQRKEVLRFKASGAEYRPTTERKRWLLTNLDFLKHYVKNRWSEPSDALQDTDGGEEQTGKKRKRHTRNPKTASGAQSVPPDRQQHQPAQCDPRPSSSCLVDNEENPTPSNAQSQPPAINPVTEDEPHPQDEQCEALDLSVSVEEDEMGSPSQSLLSGKKSDILHVNSEGESSGEFSNKLYTANTKGKRVPLQWPPTTDEEVDSANVEDWMFNFDFDTQEYRPTPITSGNAASNFQVQSHSAETTMLSKQNTKSATEKTCTPKKVTYAPSIGLVVDSRRERLSGLRSSVLGSRCRSNKTLGTILRRTVVGKGKQTISTSGTKKQSTCSNRTAKTGRRASGSQASQNEPEGSGGKKQNPQGQDKSKKVPPTGTRIPVPPTNAQAVRSEVTDVTSSDDDVEDAAAGLENMFPNIKNRPKPKHQRGKTLVDKSAASMYDSVTKTLDYHRQVADENSIGHRVGRFVQLQIDNMPTERAQQMVILSINTSCGYGRLGLYDAIQPIPPRPTVGDLPGFPPHGPLPPTIASTSSVTTGGQCTANSQRTCEKKKKQTKKTYSATRKKNSSTKSAPTPTPDDQDETEEITSPDED